MKINKITTLVSIAVIMSLSINTYSQGGRQIVPPKSAHDLKKAKVLARIERKQLKEEERPIQLFVVSKKGTVYPGPAGVSGPKVANNGKGVVFEGKPATPGGPSMLRIMEPRPAIGNAPAYPNGVVVYGKRHANGTEQNVKPDGKSGSRNDVHIPFH